jgi:Predicted hydrolases or acyltransferases (alpha/beta hydrolase superfamily)
MKFLIIIIIILSASVLHAQTPSTDNIFKKLHYCKLPGTQDSVLCGSVPVIENRQTNKGRVINLNIIVVPALMRDSLLTPIFDIDGGPGLADTKNASFYADRSNPYRKYHDIVLVDVRGTGGSNSLYCPSLQNKKKLNEQLENMYPPEKVKQCYKELSKIADLTQYTTTNVVKDFEDVRKWLDYKKISLFSLSYGTRVALVYMKMFPSSIESCILWSPTPTYSRMPLYHAKYAQNSLDKLFIDCRNDTLCNNAFPNFKKEFYSLKQKDQQPFKFSVPDSSGHSKQYSMSWDVMETKLRSLMYSPEGLRTIPFLIHQLYLGNINPFIKLFLQSMYQSKVFSEGFYLCVTCSEDVPFINSADITSLTRGTFVGTYRIDQQKQACQNWARGTVPKDFLNAVHSDIPTLIFSGGFDPVTPTSLAKEIASHLTNSTLVIIPAMSHMFDGLSNIECFDNLSVSFFNNPVHPKWDLGCVRSMKPGPYKLKE